MDRRGKAGLEWEGRLIERVTVDDVTSKTSFYHQLGISHPGYQDKVHIPELSTKK